MIASQTSLVKPRGSASLHPQPKVKGTVATGEAKAKAETAVTVKVTEARRASSKVHQKGAQKKLILHFIPFCTCRPNFYKTFSPTRHHLLQLLLQLQQRARSQWKRSTSLEMSSTIHTSSYISMFNIRVEGFTRMK